jgi:hypothetical protein
MVQYRQLRDTATRATDQTAEKKSQKTFKKPLTSPKKYGIISLESEVSE